MRKEEFTENGKTYIRVNKTVARKHFDNFDNVIVAPNTVDMVHNNWRWVYACIINRESYTPSYTFDIVIDDFHYYNTDCFRDELNLGKYEKFFIEK